MAAPIIRHQHIRVAMFCVWILVAHTDCCTHRALQIADVIPKIISFWDKPLPQSSSLAAPIQEKSSNRIHGTVSIINISQELNIVDERYLSVAIDSHLIRVEWGAFDFNSDKLKNLARALSPAILRIGGTDADFLLFNDTTTSSRIMPAGNLHDQLSSTSYDKYIRKDNSVTNFTMTVYDWDSINTFAADVGWDILFDLNMLLRNGSLWDSTNAEDLLRYTTKKSYRIAGWELGNEPNLINHYSNVTVDADQLGRDFVSLRQLLNKYGFQESLLVGPDVTNPTTTNHINTEGNDVIGQSSTEILKRFLRSCGNSTNATTWHSYSLDGRNATVDNFTDPQIMNELEEEIHTVRSLVHKYRPYLPKSWLGETAGAYGGGAPGLSNTYAGGFLWLDKLGMAAKYGVDLVIRQTFYGGNYGLLDQELNPTPVYWLSVLYKKLVGPIVLNVNISVENGRNGNTLPRDPTHIRAYAHCTNNNTRLSAKSNGSITLFMINLQKKHHVTLSLGGDLAHKTVYQYLLSPHGGKNITSTKVDLNGKELQLTESDTIPPLDGHQLAQDEPIDIPPLTFGFFVIEANVTTCQ